MERICTLIILLPLWSMVGWAGETINVFKDCSEAAMKDGHCYMYTDSLLGPIMYEKPDCLATMEAAG